MSGGHNFRLFAHNQSGNFWTKEERDKGVFVAKRALAKGQDPERAVQAYMGMDDAVAADCAKRAQRQLLAEQRRPVHA